MLDKKKFQETGNIYIYLNSSPSYPMSESTAVFNLYFDRLK